MQKSVGAAFFLSLAIFVTLPGCAPDPTAESAVGLMSVDAAKESREIFDRTGGKWEALTAADKARLIEVNGKSEQKAKQTWDIMANPNRGAMPSSQSQ